MSSQNSPNLGIGDHRRVDRHESTSAASRTPTKTKVAADEEEHTFKALPPQPLLNPLPLSNAFDDALQISGLQADIFQNAWALGPLPKAKINIKSIRAVKLVESMLEKANADVKKARSAVDKLSVRASKHKKAAKQTAHENAEHELTNTKTFVDRLQHRLAVLPYTLADAAFAAGMRMCSPAEVLSYLHHNPRKVRGRIHFFCATTKTGLQCEIEDFYRHAVHVVVTRVKCSALIETLPKRILGKVPKGEVVVFARR